MNKKEIIHQFSKEAKEWIKRNKGLKCENCPLARENHIYMLAGQSLCCEERFDYLNKILGTNYVFKGWSCVDLVSALINDGENYKEEELE